MVPPSGSAGSAAAADEDDEDDDDLPELPSSEEVAGFVTGDDKEIGDASIELTMAVVTAHLEGIEDVESLRVICDEVGAEWG
jgi:hypothetical protein